MNAAGTHRWPTLAALLALAALTIFAIPSRNVPLLLLSAMAKVVLVTWQFMELRHAHAFWRVMIVVLTGGTLAVASLLAAR